MCWIVVARSRTRPPAAMSSTRRPTRSQPRNLLSIARLKSARSRLRRFIRSRTRTQGDVSGRQDSPCSVGSADMVDARPLHRSALLPRASHFIATRRARFFNSSSMFQRSFSSESGSRCLSRGAWVNYSRPRPDPESPSGRTSGASSRASVWGSLLVLPPRASTLLHRRGLPWFRPMGRA